ncbi:unnamed protein product [Rhodiola kirilowii]
MSTLFLNKICAPLFVFSHRHCSSIFNSRTLPIISQTPTTKTARPLYSKTTAAILTDTNSNLETIIVEEEVSKCTNLLACPICYRPLVWNGAPLSVGSTSGVVLQCRACKKSYIGIETHLELTIVSETNEYGELMPAATELFRTPLVSYLYERGWRQGFGLGGFPGPEKEFEMSKEYLKPVLGGNIIDASCGSGMFSRLFAKSGLFSTVIALDFSENMLKECYQFIQQEENFPKEKLTLVRADIARLPFVSSSIDAVHAGAALHCWPSPSIAVSEISRVLRPGGVFVATTYIADGPFSALPIVKDIRERIGQVSGSRIFLSEGEFEELFSACGLVGFTCVRYGVFVMLSAAKPS